MKLSDNIIKGYKSDLLKLYDNLGECTNSYNENIVKKRIKQVKDIIDYFDKEQ